jgi:hypothetical protein
VKKWTDIGLNTEPCNFEATKGFAIDAYKVAKLDPPKYFFLFKSPFSAMHAIFQMDALSEFDDNYKDTKIHSDTSVWINIFNEMYDQYSAQYKEIKWDDDVKARMLSFVSQAYNSPEANNKLRTHFDGFMYGAHDAAWLSFYDFFYQEFDLECTHDLIPSFEIAKNCGWWSAYSDVVIFQDRPSNIVMNEANVLHNENGPAITYRDDYKIYCLEGYWVPELVVMDPDKITPEMIENEENAEKRRIMLQRYGYDRYFQSSNCKVIDQDEVPVANNDKRTMPRMLIETKNKDRFLVGTDGSTQRVYVMPILREVKTCKEAHQQISGLAEENCLAQS